MMKKKLCCAKLERVNKERYQRQTALGEIGEQGQAKLLGAHIAIVGCGGLGAIAASYLAGAGVGQLTLVDGDVPDVSNLHRQVFFNDRDKNETKSMVMAKHIQRLNPDVECIVKSSYLTKQNINEFLENADIILECTDSVMTKYLVNDYCHLQSKPLVYGAIHKYEGYVSLFANANTNDIHLRDVFPTPNLEIPTCSEVGVLATIAGIIGLMQANEALKWILGIGKSLEAQLLTYNVLDYNQLILKLKKSYTSDLKEMYEQSDYLDPVTTIVPEISLRDLFGNRSSYTLISILEDEEHESIDQQVLQMPLATINPEKWESPKKPVVFYCSTGKRSSRLVEQILSHDADATVFSLKEGLSGYQKLKTR